MRTAPYLYRSDIAADWYGLYRSFFSAASGCVVVDDNLQICGNVDALKLISSPQDSRISSLYSTENNCIVADETTPILEISKQMVAQDISLAYLTRDGRLSGVLTANDILRYHQITPFYGSGALNFSSFEEISFSESKSVYSVSTDGKTSITTNAIFDIASYIASKVYYERFGYESSFSSGTFFSYSPVLPSEFTVSCSFLRPSASNSVLELEIHNGSEYYARCMLVVENNM